MQSAHYAVEHKVQNKWVEHAQYADTLAVMTQQNIDPAWQVGLWRVVDLPRRRPLWGWQDGKWVGRGTVREELLA